MTLSEAIFDNYFIWVALICSSLIILDWFLGPRIERELRENIESFWIYLDDLTLKEKLKTLLDEGHYVINSTIISIYRLFNLFFKKTWIVLIPFILISGLLVISAFLALEGLDIEEINRLTPEELGRLSANTEFIQSIIHIIRGMGFKVEWLDYLKEYSIFCLSVMISIYILWLFYIISSGVTLTLLYVGIYANSFIVYLLIVLIDIKFANFILVFSKGFAYATDHGHFFFIKVGLAENYCYWLTHLALSLATLLPTIIHMVLLSICLITLVFEKYFKYTLKIIILRVVESDKRILTQVSLGGGFLVKLAHVIFKFSG